ncbi:MAG: MgtC/SapB family protein [Candidatus Pacebacteria bacterium]|nr:MgtC/SapB family protein [Candidatus Paceibacterota bacterium]
MEPIFFSSTFIIFGKILLAVVLGVLLGTERSVFANKRAGMRTYALVSLAACLFAVISVQVTSQYLGLVTFDPMRVAAGIITGIGFLGTGLIIFHDNKLQGLTTAAGLWVAAGIGLAVAYELYAVAIFTTIITVLIFSLLWNLEEWFGRIADTHRRVRLEREQQKGEPRV